jgi:hypothetical protein
MRARRASWTGLAPSTRVKSLRRLFGRTPPAPGGDFPPTPARAQTWSVKWKRLPRGVFGSTHTLPPCARATA